MKKFNIIIIGLVILLLITATVSFWRHSLGPPPGNTIIELSGVAGSPFEGYYVRGKRVAVSGVLPWVLDTTGITKFEFRKTHPDDVVAFAARYDEASGVHAIHSRELAKGVAGVRGRFQNGGLATEILRP